jgi:S-adenosylmethionine decarboxylase
VRFGLSNDGVNVYNTRGSTRNRRVSSRTGWDLTGDSRVDLIRPKKLRLESFNNLTKTLSFNIYDICYAKSEKEQRGYLAYIDEAYKADRLTGILGEVAEIIGAQILNVAHQDYEPEGASVTMLIAEQPIVGPMGVERAVSMNDAVVAHLDKSHITVHTYPEKHPDSGISTFRVDIDVSTCGQISPLRALNHLIHSFESDIVITDYRVRGFTRDVRGVKHFIDHKIGSIQDFIERGILNRYQAIDVNVYQENIFHTKMMLKEFKLDDYLFAVSEDDLTGNEKRTVTQRLKREMAEIFYGTNVGK